MIIPVSKFLRILRKSSPSNNAFANIGAPEVGEKWSAVCHAVADFLETARNDAAVGYDTAIANVDALVHAAPIVDLERMDGVRVVDLTGDEPVEIPVKQSGQAPSTVNLSDLTEAEIDAFVAALEKIPTADDPNDDTKE